MWQHLIEASPYVILVMAFLLVRVLRVFTTHQQKMTEILSRSNGDQAEISSLRKDVAELKSMIQDHVLAGDDRRMTATPPPAPDLAERLSAGK